MLRWIEPERVKQGHEGFLEDRLVQSVGQAGPRPLSLDKVCLLQHGEVAGHRGPGEVELARQLARRHRALAEERKDPAAGWIGQGLVDAVRDGLAPEDYFGRRRI